MNLSTKKNNQKKKSMTSTEVLKHNETNLLAEIQSQENKRRKIETQCISLNKENETVIQEKQQLMARLCSVKHDAKEQEQELLQCGMQQETIWLEALEAFNNGVQHAAKEQHRTMLLPEKIVAESLTSITIEAFDKVHAKKKGPKQCAAIAIDAVWNLFSGKCQSHLQQWITKVIRQEVIWQENPYRQAKEKLLVEHGKLGTSLGSVSKQHASTGILCSCGSQVAHARFPCHQRLS
jgi:hypothetical protein